MDQINTSKTTKDNITIDSFVDLWNQKLDGIKSMIAELSKEQFLMEEQLRIQDPSVSLIADVNMNYCEQDKQHTDTKNQLIDFMNTELQDLARNINNKQEKVTESFIKIKEIQIERSMKQTQEDESFLKSDSEQEEELDNEPLIQFRVRVERSNIRTVSFNPIANSTPLKAKEKKFKCSHCDFASITDYHLKRHIKIHDKIRVKEIKCEVCDYATDRNDNLQRHIKNRHLKRKD
jgi:hypothetical protein